MEMEDRTLRTLNWHAPSNAAAQSKIDICSTKPISIIFRTSVRACSSEARKFVNIVVQKRVRVVFNAFEHLLINVTRYGLGNIASFNDLVPPVHPAHPQHSYVPAGEYFFKSEPLQRR